jgi:hypothetical protein
VTAKKLKVQEKKILCILALAFLAQLASSEIVLTIDLTAQSDGSFEINHLEVAPGRPSFYVRPGNYLLRITDEKDNVIVEQKLDLPFYIMTDPPEPVNYSTIYLKVPYSRNMSGVKFYNGTRLMFSEKLELCKKDGACDLKRENALTCPADCKPEEPDGICLPAGGICDPDCAEGVDTDCVSASKGTVSKGSPTYPNEPAVGKGSDDADHSLLGVIVALFALCAIVIFFYRRHRLEKIKKQREQFIKWKEEKERVKN